MFSSRGNGTANASFHGTKISTIEYLSGGLNRSISRSRFISRQRLCRGECLNFGRKARVWCAHSYICIFKRLWDESWQWRPAPIIVRRSPPTTDPMRQSTVLTDSSGSPLPSAHLSFHSISSSRKLIRSSSSFIPFLFLPFIILQREIFRFVYMFLFFLIIFIRRIKWASSKRRISGRISSLYPSEASGTQATFQVNKARSRPKTCRIPRIDMYVCICKDCEFIIDRVFEFNRI